MPLTTVHRRRSTREEDTWWPASCADPISVEGEAGLPAHLIFSSHANWTTASSRANAA